MLSLRILNPDHQFENDFITKLGLMPDDIKLLEDSRQLASQVQAQLSDISAKEVALLPDFKLLRDDSSSKVEILSKLTTSLSTNGFLLTQQNPYIDTLNKNKLKIVQLENDPKIAETVKKIRANLDIVISNYKGVVKVHYQQVEIVKEMKNSIVANNSKPTLTGGPK